MEPYAEYSLSPSQSLMPWANNNYNVYMIRPDDATIKRHVQYAGNFVSLSVHDAENLRSAALSLFAQRHLQELHIGGIHPEAMSDKAVVWIRTILKESASLREISLRSDFISSKCLQYISRFGQKLTSLELIEYCKHPELDHLRATDDSIRRLFCQLPKLEKIKLHLGKLTAASLLSIRTLTELNTLTLDFMSNVNDDLICQLLSGDNALPNLSSLSLPGTPITQLALLSIHKKKSITNLDVRFCHIPSNEFALLKHNNALKSLDVCFTNADNTLFDNLPPKLQTLALSHSNVTEDAVQLYRENHPHVTVKWEN